MTETANLAHAVLPACSFAEKDGTFTNIERRVQRIRRPSNLSNKAARTGRSSAASRSAWDIPWSIGSAEAIMEEIASLVPFYGGHSTPNLERGGVFWPCPEGRSAGGEPAFCRRLGRRAGTAHPGPGSCPADGEGRCLYPRQGIDALSFPRRHPVDAIHAPQDGEVPRDLSR